MRPQAVMRLLPGNLDHLRCSSLGCSGTRSSVAETSVAETNLNMGTGDRVFYVGHDLAPRGKTASTSWPGLGLQIRRCRGNTKTLSAKSASCEGANALHRAPMLLLSSFRVKELIGHGGRD